MRQDSMPYTDFTAPGVEVHCLYGEGFQTVERYIYMNFVQIALDTENE